MVTTCSRCSTRTNHLFSLPPQYRLWTWLLFYLTGQLFNDPRVTEWIRDPRVIKASIIALPFVYLFTWFYERHFFFRAV
ncbi:acyltransferase [Klebsiella variicola]|uniref:Acyltransferase n=1 Tax=Klebsiella variicola TaxID=244366 RepID=A0A7H4MG35_KLEVA|nr:acyltransferase [Klebsiella variicola]